jgi:hypothetical protein
MQGVMWTLPKKMFSELGGRLTGSLALSFIPGHIQQGGTVASKAEDFPPQPKAILAHAVVYGPRDEIWAPGQREFIRLQVAPTLPPAKQ